MLCLLEVQRFAFIRNVAGVQEDLYRSGRGRYGVEIEGQFVRRHLLDNIDLLIDDDKEE